MATLRKITVKVPAGLLERAQEASGQGITETVRAGLQLVAASRVYAPASIPWEGTIFTEFLGVEVGPIRVKDRPFR